MRKFVILALAAVFVVAMATYTLATEFKFGGSYLTRGIYWDTGVDKGDGRPTAAGGSRIGEVDDVNYYDVRLRFDMTAKVTDKLSFTCQADSGLGYGGDYERDNPLSTPDSYHGIWSGGGFRELGEIAPNERGSWYADGFPDGDQPLGHAAIGTTGGNQVAAGNTASTQRDILFQRAYLKWDTGPVTLKLGRQWAFWGHGLVEGMNRNRIEFEIERPSFCMAAGLDKWAEGDLFLDQDDVDHYFAYFKITNPNFEFGPFFGLARCNRPDSTDRWNATYYSKDTHMYYNSWMWKYVMGGLKFSGEYVYKWGKTGAMAGLDSLQNYNQHGMVYDITYDVGMCKVGFQQGYFTGDSQIGRNGNVADRSNTAFKTSYSFSPFLILGEVMVNGLSMDGTAVAGTNMNCNYISNVHYFRWFTDAAPTKNLSLTASIAYAKANQPIHIVNRTALDEATVVNARESKGKSMGTEMDITGTYKLTENLSYTAAWGYLWAGGYWDTLTDGPNGGGTNALTPRTDDAMVLLHQLAITF